MASSGVLVSAHIPPAMPNTERMMTRKALRALASMMRSSRSVERGAGGASERPASGAGGVAEGLAVMVWDLCVQSVEQRTRFYLPPALALQRNTLLAVRTTHSPCRTT